MSNSISNGFIHNYASEVHTAYQARGSKLRNTVRVQSKVVGSTCVFQKTGKGTAGLKTRHGNVPLMNVDHSTVSCDLEDWYGADYVDKLDQLKGKHDERNVIVDAGAWALGRKVDELLVTRMDDTSTIIPEASTGLTKAKIMDAFGMLNLADVPDDGNRFAIVGAHQWNELLDISEFKSADYVGPRYSWLEGTEARKWLGINWIFHSGLPIENGTRKCFMYHKNAIGLAEAQEVTCYVDWVPEKAAHLVNHMLSAGACLIDETGIIEIQCDDDAAIAA